MELAIKARLQPWLDRVDTLELRERILLMAAGIAVMFLLVDNLWLQPTLKAQQVAEQQIADLEIRLNSLQQNAGLLSINSAADPLAPRNQRRDQLRTELAELNARVMNQLGALVEPAQAAKVLEQLLGRHAGLRLAALSASTEPLGDMSTGAAPDSPGLARYQVDMVVKGGYLEVLNYLTSLESLPWKFFWRQVNFQSSEYPHAETRLQLYTLGAAHG
jgi:MSHA biogenesis protein MshJ